MKKILLLTICVLSLSACMPAFLQTQPAPNPAPAVEVDVQATVAVSVQQTLESLPTPTLAPTNTPVVMTATGTFTPTSTFTIAPTQSTPTVTGTITGATATKSASTPTGTVIVTVGTVGTLPFTSTPNPAFSATPTATNHFQYYGTMPPNLPFGTVWLKNASKAEGYISLQCTTSDGYSTVIEYPVGHSVVKASAPAGSYVYVAWVGGKKFSGKFRLSKQGESTITMYKDKVTVK